MNKETLHKILRSRWTFYTCLVVWFFSMPWESGWSLIPNLLSIGVMSGCFWSYYTGIKENHDKVKALLNSLIEGETNE